MENTGKAMVLIMQTIDEQERLIERLKARIQDLEQQIVQAGK